MYKNVIIIGAGGHAKVIADIVIKCGDHLMGYLDDNADGTVAGVPVLGKICDAAGFAAQAEFVIGIGDNGVRKQIALQQPLQWYTALHPSAQIAFDVKLEAGTVVMANAVINTSAVIGRHCIINTGAVIEHDNQVADYVHVSPGAVLCGTVQVGEGSHIGAGATVKNNIKICNNTVIGCGGVVVKNIAKSGVYIGVPVRAYNK